MQYFAVRNFEKYQHGHVRNYSWVKIHKCLLDDYDFMTLPDGMKWVFIGLILLAGRGGNRLPLDSEYLRIKLGLASDYDLKPLFRRRFLLALPGRPVLAQIRGEEIRGDKTRGEGESEGETHDKKRGGKRPFPNEFGFTTEMREWANRKGCPDAGRQFERFKAHHMAKASCFSNWDMAWKNWILKSVEMKEQRHG